MSIDAEFMQADLALSVLDYLSPASRSEEFAGRSVFRNYATKRPIVFANVYKRWLGGLGTSGDLSICPEDFQSCSTYELPDGRLFSPNRIRRETDPTAVAFLKAMVARSKQPKDRPRTLTLLAEPIVPIRSARGMQVLFGGQYLFVPAYTRIDVDLDVEVVGQPGSVSLGHMLKAYGKKFPFRKRLPPLQTGDRLTLSYSYMPTEPLKYLECLATARKISGDELALKFRTARMTLVPPRSGQSPDFIGLQVRDLQITQSRLD